MIKKNSMFDDKSMFGKDFKYILSLTALAWIAYTLPQVQASMQSVATPIGDLSIASASSQPAQVYSSPTPTPTPGVCSGALMGGLSLDPSSPLTSTLPVTDTTNKQYLGLPILAFDVSALTGNLHVKNLVVHISTTGAGRISAAYLYRGSTQLASAVVSGNVAQFINIPVVNIAQGSNVPLIVKVDAVGITSNTVISSNVQSSDLTLVDIYGNGATVSGSATGNSQTVVPAGALLTLSGTPTITKTVISTDASGNQTVKYTATFNVNAQAVGTNVEFGLPSSANPAFGNASTPTNLAQVFVNGAPVTGVTVTASYGQPINTVLDTSTSFLVAANQVATIPVTYSFVIVNPRTNVYQIQLQGVNVVTQSGQSYINFMTNQTAWRSAAI